MEGWIKLHRELLEWEWYDHIPTKTLFIHLLLKCNHKNNTYRGTEVKRGQTLTGRKQLSVETGLTERQIRTSLSNLKSTNEIAIKSTSKGSVVTIVKYDSYQDSDYKSTSKTPTRSPNSDKQTTTNNNDNNDNINLLSDEVICYLNEKLNKSFKTTDKVKRMIGARNKDGYKLEDFKKVIDSKYEEWIGKDKMKNYLRPSTLFGTKFDEYHGAVTDKEAEVKSWKERNSKPVGTVNDIF